MLYYELMPKQSPQSNLYNGKLWYILLELLVLHSLFVQKTLSQLLCTYRPRHLNCRFAKGLLKKYKLASNNI